MIPNKITINGFDYNIEYIEGKDERLNYGNSLGYIDTGDLKIVISKDMPEQKQKEIILHEIIHGCFDAVNFRPDYEEEVVEELARPLYQVLKENNINFE